MFIAQIITPNKIKAVFDFANITHFTKLNNLDPVCQEGL